MSGWGFAIMSIWTVLFAALVIVGLVAAARILRAPADRLPQARPTPEDLLGERFARGEIDEQEYRQSLETVRSVRRSGIEA
ncbi:SHOCT domain-containing protein [Pseudonocardia zijingensis]|jgi:putative membrane protein